jgi:predicted RecA/RadA family phage recombinase
MKNFVQKGDSFKFVAGSAIASGDIVKSGKLVGVALDDVASGDEGIAYIEGVYEVAKKAGVAFSQGDVVYEESSEASDVVGDKMGHAFEDADAGDATMKVKLER